MKIFARSWLRWSAWGLLAVLFAASCVVLANWQLDRREQAVSKIQRMIANYDKTPIEFDQIKDLSIAKVTPLEWTPVQLSGRYLPDDELLVRNRPIAGQPGFLQIVPFQLDDGGVVLVERGWIPADSDLAPALDMTPGAGSKIVVGRVKLGEQTPNRDSPPGFATSFHLASLEDNLQLDIEQEFYLRLASESPGETQTPQPLGKPLLDEGNHLSYAVQWVLFALMGFFALFWAIRQELEFQKSERDPSYVPKSKRIKKITDGEIEDDLIDANSRR